jgi:hypothetical protein
MTLKLLGDCGEGPYPDAPLTADILKAYPTELHTIKPITLFVGQTGITFRRGTKWEGITPGFIFDLTVGPDHTPVGKGRVVKSRTCVFQDIPEEAICLNHTGNYSYAGIHKAMLRAYGGDFSEGETIVLVEYLRLSAGSLILRVNL